MLTGHEKKVVLAILIIFLLGAAIRWQRISKRTPSPVSAPPAESAADAIPSR